MASNTVTVSGMFGQVDGQYHTYFADSPVVIDVSDLQWPEVTSPFCVVQVDVIYDDKVAGSFRADTAGQTEISFDISSALRAIWADYGFDDELEAANNAGVARQRGYRAYSLKVYTEYIDGTDGTFTRTESRLIDGGQCMIGGLTEWERFNIDKKEDADASHWENKNLRNGDASTKPTESPERVGQNSITSWVDVSNSGTQSVFYPSTATAGADSQSAHAPIVLRDSQPYVDFLFVNRRGAVETCSALTKESMGISVESKQYNRVERPSFIPTRSLMALGSDGRRSWQMSSGYVTREWAEWWTMEFLGGKRKRWWMLYKGPGMATAAYVPVTVEPAKKSTGIYDRTKQQMPSVEFTVTLALEG